jgi:hypothetical protein
MTFTIAPIDLIGILVSVLLIFKGISLVRNKNENVFEFLLWMSLGSVLLILSLSSAITVIDTIDVILSGLWILGFKSGVNGIFLLTNLVLLALLFYTYSNIKSNEQKISNIHQEIALKEYELSNEFNTPDVGTDDD